MKVLPSAIPGVAIYAPDSVEFETSLTDILGRAPRELLKAALPFSVIVENLSSNTIALLGVRFDMLGAKGKQYSVVHYADTLRNPQKSELRAGAKRFVCAEPAYTTLVIRGQAVADTRGRMNLENLRRMIQIRASLDCVAFEDGRFTGPDSQEAFERFAAEREKEVELIAEVRAMTEAGVALTAFETLLYTAVQDPDYRSRRHAARKLIEGLESGGVEEMSNRARDYRYRIALWREPA
jgi:hypothetical protein